MENLLVLRNISDVMGDFRRKRIQNSNYKRRIKLHT